jgi:hypothetical protein
MTIEFDELLQLLQALDGVRQDRRYHPEGDALYHSLQAFECARRTTQDRTLWAAALLHDVGKAVSSPDHDTVGADLLDGLVSPRIVWCVRHHLDLLRDPRATRRRLRHAPNASRDLEQLRRFDLAGRDPRATVPTPKQALEMLRSDSFDLSPSGDAAPHDDHEEDFFTH